MTLPGLQWPPLCCQCSWDLSPVTGLVIPCSLISSFPLISDSQTALLPAGKLVWFISYFFSIYGITSQYIFLRQLCCPGCSPTPGLKWFSCHNPQSIWEDRNGSQCQDLLIHFEWEPTTLYKEVLHTWIVWRLCFSIFFRVIHLLSSCPLWKTQVIFLKNGHITRRYQETF